MKFLIPCIATLLALPLAAEAAPLNADTLCYQACPTTPSGKSPMDFFNISAFQSLENCHALQGLCQWVQRTQPLEIKPVVVADYDGTQVAEKITINANQTYISDRERSENSVAFGVVAPKLKSLGYDIGMQTGDLSNTAAAQYIAARDNSCETAEFNSKQVKFDYCIGERMVGMTAQQVKALHGVMYRVFPELNTYFSVTQAMLNYLVDMGYPFWTATGGTPYPALVKSKSNTQIFNRSYSAQDCDIAYKNSEVMNRTCHIIYDAPKIGRGKVTLVMNTENVCEGVSYVEAQKTQQTQMCINDGAGKVSGLHTIEKRSKNAVLNFHANSSGDLDPALYVAQQGGIVFMHNNSAVCEVVNKKVPGTCFNIVDADVEKIKKLTEPSDEDYVNAAEREGLVDDYIVKKNERTTSSR